MARQRRGFRVQSLDSGADRPQSDWQARLVEDRKWTPADVAIARLDVAEWLCRMPHRRRQIAERLAAGYATAEVASQFRLSAGRVSQMRREFERSWQEFQS